MILAVSELGWVTLAAATISALGVVITGVIGVRGKRENTREHGESMTVLQRIESRFEHFEARIDDRLANIDAQLAEVNRAHVAHLEDHLDHTPTTDRSEIAS